jgi:heme exporter protein D
MKWITLKIYLLPLIMQEVDTVIEKYINLINELRRTNEQETLNEFEDLRDSVNFIK